MNLCKNKQKPVCGASYSVIGKVIDQIANSEYPKIKEEVVEEPVSTSVLYKLMATLFNSFMFMLITQLLSIRISLGVHYRKLYLN